MDTKSKHDWVEDAAQSWFEDEDQSNQKGDVQVYSFTLEKLETLSGGG
jgi:hypothetical protein